MKQGSATESDSLQLFEKKTIVRKLYTWTCIYSQDHQIFGQSLGLWLSFQQLLTSLERQACEQDTYRENKVVKVDANSFC